MKISIITKKPVIKTRNNLLAYIKITASNFLQYEEENKYTFIVKDIACIENAEGYKELNVLNEYPKEFSFEEVNTFFSLLSKDIVSTKNFTDQYLQIQKEILLKQLQLNPLYGTEAKDWIML